MTLIPLFPVPDLDQMFKKRVLAYVSLYNGFFFLKIIPPKNWVPRKEGYENVEQLGLAIRKPLLQTAKRFEIGCFQQTNTFGKNTTISKFVQNARKYQSQTKSYSRDVSRDFWDNLGAGPREYGADIEQSLFDSDMKVWNLNNLENLLKNAKIKIPGVTSSYLYVGTHKSAFAWHCEDQDLYSINYLHCGGLK